MPWLRRQPGLNICIFIRLSKPFGKYPAEIYMWVASHTFSLTTQRTHSQHGRHSSQRKSLSSLQSQEICTRLLLSFDCPHPSRFRFQKCDGARPSCGRCTANQRPCEYRERPKKVDVLETQVVSLTNRLRILEMRRVKPCSPALSIGIDDIPARWWEADEPPEIVSRAL